MKITDENVINIINKNYENLFSAEKKVAKYILNNPDKAVNMNVAELSKASMVSEATVVRTSQHLGFKGFYQMKLILMRDLGNISSEKDDKNNPFTFLISKKIETLNSINAESNHESIMKLIRSIINAKRIYIISAGNTIPVGNDLEFRLNRLGISAFTSDISENMINYLINGSKLDLAILISNSGLSKNVLQALDISKDMGIESFAITSDVTSPLANNSTHCIFSGKDFFDFNNTFHGTESHLGLIFINDLIIYLLADMINKGKDIKKLNSELEYFSSWKM